MNDNKKKHLIILIIALGLIIAAVISVFAFIKKTNDISRSEAKAKIEERLSKREKTEAENIAEEKTEVKETVKTEVANKKTKDTVKPVEEVSEKMPDILEDIENIDAGETIDKEAIEFDELERYFNSYEISDAVFERIYGDDRSYKTYCTVPIEDLRYLKMLHIGFDEKIHVGEMIVNKAISDDIIEIFTELFKAEYQIEKMLLVDNYGANDSVSIADNNSSAFNFRTVTGGTALSYHGMGCAVDINPINNPYIWYDDYGNICWEDPDAELYLDRDAEDAKQRHMINHDDLCYMLFTEHGFEWGGDWNEPIDYQHFEKAAAYYSF